MNCGWSQNGLIPDTSLRIARTSGKVPSPWFQLDSRNPKSCSAIRMDFGAPQRCAPGCLVLKSKHGRNAVMFARNRYYTATRPKVDGGRRRVASALWMFLAFTAATGAARAEDPGFPAPTGDASILASGVRLDRIFDGGCMLTEGVATRGRGSRPGEDWSPPEPNVRRASCRSSYHCKQTIKRLS